MGSSSFTFTGYVKWGMRKHPHVLRNVKRKTKKNEKWCEEKDFSAIPLGLPYPLLQYELYPASAGMPSGGKMKVPLVKQLPGAFPLAATRQKKREARRKKETACIPEREREKGGCWLLLWDSELQKRRAAAYL